MKVIGLTSFFFLLSISTFSQTLSFSKDSLNVRWNEKDYMYSDTLLIFNKSNISVSLDSIISMNMISYKLKFNSDSATTEFSAGLPDQTIYSVFFAPRDSMELVVFDPDLCPICRVKTPQQYFTDTLIFITSSPYSKKNIFYLDVRGDGPSNIDGKINFPEEFKLYQNYPNPFNPTTSIEYIVPSNEFISLKVYDMLGREVATLVNEQKTAGRYNIQFDASDFSSGIYLYRIQTDNFKSTKRMTLIK